MTWQSHVVFTGESKQQEWSNDGWTSELPLSGLFSVATQSAQIDLPSYTSLRIGAWLRTKGIDRTLYLFPCRQTAVSTIKTRFFWDNDANLLLTDYYDVLNPFSYNELASTKVEFIKLSRAAEWLHLGLTVGPTYTTLYINCVPALTTATAINTWDNVQVVASQAGHATVYWLDDIYIEYSSDAEADAPPPPYHFYPFDIKSQGDSEDWGNTSVNGENSWSVMNSDPDQTIFANAASMVDLYKARPLAVIQNYDVAAIGGHVYGNFDDREIDLVVRYNSISANLPLQFFETGDVVVGSYTILDPEGNPWSIAKVRDTQIGVESL